MAHTNSTKAALYIITLVILDVCLLANDCALGSVDEIKPDRCGFEREGSVFVACLELLAQTKLHM